MSGVIGALLVALSAIIVLVVHARLNHDVPPRWSQTELVVEMIVVGAVGCLAIGLALVVSALSHGLGSLQTLGALVALALAATMAARYLRRRRRARGGSVLPPTAPLATP